MGWILRCNYSEEKNEHLIVQLKAEFSMHHQRQLIPICVYPTLTFTAGKQQNYKLLKYFQINVLGLTIYFI